MRPHVVDEPTESVCWVKKKRKEKKEKKNERRGREAGGMGGGGGGGVEGRRIRRRQASDVYYMICTGGCELYDMYGKVCIILYTYGRVYIILYDVYGRVCIV